MWKPGTLLRIRNAELERLTGKISRQVVRGHCLALVVASTSVGFGTKGEKWHAEILVNGRLVFLKNAWTYQDHLEYVVFQQ